MMDWLENKYEKLKLTSYLKKKYDDRNYIVILISGNE